MTAKTAAEAYADTIAAKRAYVFGHISSAIENCNFETQIYSNYISNDLKNELLWLGYKLWNSGNYIIIKWDCPKNSGSPNDIA